MALVTTGIEKIVVLGGETKQALMDKVMNSVDPLKLANEYLHNSSPAVQKFGCEVIANLSPSDRAKEILSEILKVKKLDEGVKNAATLVFARHGEGAIEGVQKYYETLPSGYTSHSRFRMQNAIACPNPAVIEFLLDRVGDLTTIDKLATVYTKTEVQGLTMLFERACYNQKFGYGNYARAMAAVIEKSVNPEDAINLINEKLKNGSNLERSTAMYVLNEVRGKNIDSVMENLLAILNEPKIEEAPKTGLLNWIKKHLGKDQGFEFTQADVKRSAAYVLRKYYSSPAFDDVGLQPPPTDFAQSVFKNKIVRTVIDMASRGELASEQSSSYENLCAAIGIVENNDGVKSILLNVMPSQNIDEVTFAAKTIGVMANFSYGLSQPTRAGFIAGIKNSTEEREKGMENMKSLQCFVDELMDKIRFSRNDTLCRECVEAIGNFREYGKKAEYTIAGLLENGSVETRITALRSLKEIGASTAQTQQRLRNVVRTDESMRARELAIEALGNCAHGDPRAFNVILEQLSNPFLEEAAKRAINKIDADGDLRKAATQELIIH